MGRLAFRTITLTAFRATLGVCLCTGFPAPAQTQGNVWLVGDARSKEMIDRLQRRGLLRGLDPTSRPYSRNAVVYELTALDTSLITEPERSWLRALQSELGSDRGRQIPASWGGAAEAGVRASGSGRLDPARDGGDSGLWPRYALEAWATAGPAAAHVRWNGDRWLEEDPDGRSPGQSAGGWTEVAYLSARASFGSITFGRFPQDWSAGTGGLLLSDVATPFTRLSARATVGRLTAEAVFGRLDRVIDAYRYLAVHRISYRRPGLALAVAQASVYASPSDRPSLRYVLPTEPWVFEGDEPRPELSNLMIGGQAWIRRGNVTARLEGILDGYDLGNAPTDPEQFAVEAEVRYARRGSRLEPVLRYRVVSAFAYRSVTGTDAFTFLERGLGSGYADFDDLRLGVDWYPAPPIRIAPRIRILRQGEGMLRFPAAAFGPGAPSLFLGTRETTLRLGLAGFYLPASWLWMSWDIGWNRVTNDRHRKGVDRSRFGGSLSVGGRWVLERRDDGRRGASRGTLP